MVAQLIDLIVQFVTGTVSAVGYIGVLILMTFESACIPIPSEIIMPFSGFLVFSGKLNIWLVTLAGATGNLIGAVITYAIGFYGGRPFILKYGKYFFVKEKEVHHAEKFFAKWGDWSVFLSRNLPVIRTFISLPAGVAEMPFIKFAVFSFLGSLPWCFALTYLGFLLGSNWLVIREYGHYLDIIAGLAIVAFIGKIIWDYYTDKNGN
ncbi:MAG: DedA family protein [Candidatus Margulisbacteria bacterium]|nr:DedA family protein [Candidatus Margulisiibacteriota bacterium]